MAGPVQLAVTNAVERHFAEASATTPLSPGEYEIRLVHNVGGGGPFTLESSAGGLMSPPENPLDPAPPSQGEYVRVTVAARGSRSRRTSWRGDVSDAAETVSAKQERAASAVANGRERTAPQAAAHAADAADADAGRSLGFGGGRRIPGVARPPTSAIALDPTTDSQPDTTCPTLESTTRRHGEGQADAAWQSTSGGTT